MSGNVTEVLAGFAASLQYDDLPGQVRDHCKNVLLDTLACAVAGHRGEETRTARCPGFGAGAIQREQRHWRRPAVARRRDNSERLSRHRGHHVRHPPLDADPCDAGGDPARVGDRRARRLVGPRPAGRARRRMRGDDAGWDWHRLSGLAGQGLARPGRARAVRRRRGGRPASQVRHRDHGQGVRPCRQPGGRHLRGVGNADREIPPVPRRAFGADGGAAGRAEIPGDARIPDRQGRRPVQHLFERRPARELSQPISESAGSSNRSRCGYGRPPRRSRA